MGREESVAQAKAAQREKEEAAHAKKQERKDGISGDASSIEKILFSHFRFFLKNGSMWAAPRVQQWAREAHGLPSQKARVDELRAERDARARTLALLRSDMSSSGSAPWPAAHLYVLKS